jgi:hypothetical protein
MDCIDSVTEEILHILILQGRRLVKRCLVIAVLDKAPLGPFMHTVGCVTLFRLLEDGQQQQQQQRD